MANTDKNSYTIIFAIIMVVVVGGILASLASGLKPLVKANEKYEKQQNVLYALGVNDNEGPGDVKFLGTDVVEDKFKSIVKKQLLIKGSEIKEIALDTLVDIKKKKKQKQKTLITKELCHYMLQKRMVKSCL